MRDCSSLLLAVAPVTMDEASSLSTYKKKQKKIAPHSIPPGTPAHFGLSNFLETQRRLKEQLAQVDGLIAGEDTRRC